VKKCQACSYRLVVISSAIYFILTVVSPVAFATVKSQLITDLSLIEPSPNDHWQTLRTQHFNIHFSGNNNEFAAHVAQLAEQIHDKFQPVLRWNPHKTNIVINDSVDDANGYASPVNHNKIVVNVSPPTSGDLMDHASLVEQLLTHEYTHILHLDQAENLPRLIRDLFGEGGFTTPFSFPQLFSPRWVSEGLAIYNESSNGFGRMNSAVYHSKMRAEVARGLRDYTEMSYQGYYNSNWPFGQVYLYGAFWFKFLQEKYGEEVLYEYIFNYNKNVIPWRMHSRSLNTFGKAPEVVWGEFQAYLETFYQPHIDRIKALKSASKKVIAKQKYINSLPTRGPKGSVIYFHNDMITHPEIRLADSKGHITTLLKQKSVSALNFHPDAGLLISKASICDNTKQYSDLYRYDFKSEKIEKLTHCARLPRAIWSNEGREVYAAQQDGGKTHLVKVSTLDGQIEQIVSFQLGEALGEFDVSKDGNRIIASVKRAQTGWNLEELDLETRQWQKITQSPYQEQSPKYSKNGREIYFIKETTDNQQQELFALDITRNKIHQVTHSLGYIQGFALAETATSQVWLQEYTSESSQISLTSRQSAISPSTDNRPEPLDLSGLLTVTSKPERSPFVSHSAPYSPLETLTPQHWSPFFSIGGQNPYAAIILNGSDVLGFHQWLFSPVYYMDPQLKKSGFAARYNFYNRLSLGAIHGIVPRFSSTLSGASMVGYEARHILQAALNYPLNGMDSSWNWGLATAREQSKIVQFEGNQSLIRTDTLVGAGLSFNNLNYYPHGVSLTDGIKADLMIESYDLVVGSEHQGLAASVELVGYVNLGHKHTVKLAGLVAAGGEHIKPFNLGNQSDLLSAIGGTTRLGKRDYALRGYRHSSLLSGTQIQRFSAEYRYPVASIYDGLTLPPVGLGKVHGAVFMDTGSAWRTGLEGAYYTGVGAELSFDLLIGYDSLSVPVKIGVAKGLDDEIGDDQLYMQVGLSF